MVDTKEMKLTRVFDASIDFVWNAFVDSEMVKKWWGPQGFTCTLANMDVREGGTSLVCMKASEAMGNIEIYNTWTYSKVVPNELLEYILRFTDKEGKALNPATMGMQGIPEEVPHTITFKSLGDKKTEVTVVEEGYASDEVVNTSKQGMEQCFDKMAVALSH